MIILNKTLHFITTVSGYSGSVLSPKKSISRARCDAILLFVMCMACVHGTSMFDCSVCLEKSPITSNSIWNRCVYNGNQKYELPCGHKFHLDCIGFWILEWHHTSCPNCRAAVSNETNIQLQKRQKKPWPQKFAETIFNMLKIIFDFTWYIIQRAGKPFQVSLLRLLPFILEIRLAFNQNRLWNKVRRTRLWKWFRKQSSNTKRKLNQYYTLIIEFPNSMWNNYIRKPIDSAQAYLLEEYNDETVEIYAYKVIAPFKAKVMSPLPVNTMSPLPEKVMSPLPKADIRHDQPVDKDTFITTFVEGDVVYSSINFANYNQLKIQDAKLMKVFVETSDARKRAHLYIHSRSTLNLKKVQSIRNKRIVSCQDLDQKIYEKLSNSAPWPMWDNFILFFKFIFILIIAPVDMMVFKLMVLSVFLASNFLNLIVHLYLRFGLHLEKYIQTVSNDTFDTYYTKKDVKRNQDTLSILKLLEL